MDVVHYRPACRADARSVAALHAENWRREYRGNFRDAYLDGDVVQERQSFWNARLSCPPANQYVCVAVQRVQLVGFVCVFGAHHPEWGSFIDNLHVNADVQRRGIGSTLMQKAGSWLSASYPQHRVYLLVWEFNPARALYERLGGIDTGILELENPGGGTGRYARYVWEQPHGFAAQIGSSGR